MTVPPPIKDLQIKYTKLFINNQFVDGVNRKTFPVIDPSTEQEFARVAEADEADVELAVQAASAAFKRDAPWRRMDASQRGYLINKLADAVERNRVELACLEAKDNGKPYNIAYLADLHLVISCLRYYAGWADKIQGKVVPVDGDFLTYTRHEPVGVCAQIIPWNFPLLMMAWKIGPALATGCTTVVKPAEQTPLSALFLASLVAEVGFPPGVLNVLPGFGPTVGKPLACHKRVDKVAFTGSTEVGKLIQGYAAANMKKVTLECGGKSPIIVLKDADLDKAVDICHLGLFFNHGQCCIAASRTYVEAPIYDAFVAKAKAKAAAMKLGDPFDPATQQGPQVDKEQFDKILSLIESGKSEGAKLETGGGRFGEKGFFVEPTVFSGVKDDMRISREEIFGPVQQILKFDSLDEVIDRANDSTYGLGAGIISEDHSRVIYLSNNLRAGTVYVNCYNVFDIRAPFGGYKMSGVGRELGEYALDNYLEVKTVYNKIDSKY